MKDSIMLGIKLALKSFLVGIALILSIGRNLITTYTKKRAGIGSIILRGVGGRECVSVPGFAFFLGKRASDSLWFGIFGSKSGVCYGLPTNLPFRSYMWTRNKFVFLWGGTVKNHGVSR